MNTETQLNTPERGVLLCRHSRNQQDYLNRSQLSGGNDFLFLPGRLNKQIIRCNYYTLHI